MAYFVKRRRAQHDQDFETWIEEGVCPTLNAFDNTGDSRATVLIVFDNSYRDGLRIQKGNTVNTLSAKMGTGGNNVPMVAQEVTHEVVGTLQARFYKGPNHENARDGQLVIQHVPVLMRGREGKPGGGKGPLLSENISLTLAGGNDQVLFEPIIAFDGYNQSVTEDIYRALRIGIDSGDCIAIPIQDGREIEKKQNGLGIGQEGDPSYTLDQTGAQSVAAEQGEEDTMQVRRLTPIECERLMGWPDNHTLPRADGKENADTTRYKMCGNGVASPVAQWIGQHLMAIMNDE